MPRKRSVPSKSPARTSIKTKTAREICTLIGQERQAHPDWAAALGYIRSVIAKTYRLSEEYGFVKPPKPKTRRKGQALIVSDCPSETEQPKKAAQRIGEPTDDSPVECVDLLNKH